MGDDILDRDPAVTTPGGDGRETLRLADLRGPDGLETLVEDLRERGIETLAQLREAGGAETLAELAGDPHARTLAAYVALDSLPTPAHVDARLIEAGIESPLDLAERPPDEIVRILGDAAAASALQEAATAQARLATTLLVDRLAATATATSCGCKRCRNATSPLAYLADLLTYAVGHVRESGAPVTVEALAARFCQPLVGLPATCEALDAKVRTARICCEVLRRHLTAHPPLSHVQSQLGDAERAYLQIAYQGLLERNGTSFVEIRAARSASRRDRVMLARRLGIDLAPGGARPDDLDLLFLDPDAAAGAPGALTEEMLEQLFGLRDTHREPLDADVTGGLLSARLAHLRARWVREDWPQAPGPDALPAIDPDVIGPSDLRDATAGAAFELYQQRSTVVGNELASARADHAQAGFDALVQDRTGLSPSNVEGLVAKREAGEPIAPLLPQGLDEAGFDHLVAVAELERAGSATREELADAFSVLVQMRKRGLFGAWRQEEKAPPGGGPPVTLSQDHFRLATGEKVLRRFRATPAARRRFVDMLRARIDQEQAILAAARAAVGATEEETLTVLRDALVFAARPSGTLDARTWVTRHFQIDAAAGACATTTRPAQAIETLQGVLFGARHGLLEDRALTLAAPSFDEEWRWIGSYASWRSSMLVFLYPEVALRPTFRRRRTPAFDALVDTLRDEGPATPAAAQAAALAYGAYFADVCSLAPAALYRATRPLDAARDLSGAPRDAGRRVLAVARAGSSGRLYFSAYAEQPGTGVSGNEAASLWREIGGLPAAAQASGLLPFQPASGQDRVALYTRITQVGAPDRVLLSTYDGTEWSAAADAGSVPVLVRACELAEGVVAPDPALTTLEPWPVRGDDRQVPVDLDGDGRAELVLLAAPEPDGTRRIGVAREREGGLVLTWSGVLPAGWDLPPGDPVALERRLDAWPWRCRRLLLVNPGQARLGVFGNGADGVPALLASTADAGGWTVVLSGMALDGTSHATSFVRADIDGDGHDELVVLVHGEGDHDTAPVSTTVVVLDFRADVFTLRFTLDVQFPTQTAPSQSAGRAGKLERPVAIRSGFGPSGSAEAGREDVLARATRNESGGLDVREDREWVLLLRYNAAANTFAIVWTADSETGGAGASGWRWNADDRFAPLELGERQQAILVTSSAQAAVGVLRYTANGRLALRWRTPPDHRIPPASGITRDWTVATGDRALPVGLDGDGISRLVLASADGTRLGVADVGASGVVLRALLDRRVAPPLATPGGLGWTIAADTRYAAADLDGDGCEELAALAGDGRLGVLRGVLRPVVTGLPSRLGPTGVSALDISPKLSPAQLDVRRPRIASAYAANEALPQNLPYLDEAYLYVPLELALRLDESGEHEAALDWLASVYDWTRPSGSRKIAHRLVLEESIETVYERAPTWLTDPLDPHAIAGTRREASTRFVLLAIARCLLGFADEEFTRGTAESVPRARALYLTVLSLLDEPALGRRMRTCSDLIATLELGVGDPDWGVLWREAVEGLDAVERYETLAGAVEEMSQVLANGDGWPQRIERARAIVDAAVAADAPHRALGELVATRRDAERAALSSVLGEPEVARTARRLSDDIAGAFLLAPPPDPGRPDDEVPRPRPAPYTPPPPVQFCVPPNPLVDALRRRAELNLHKIRTCRNIAGLSWHPEPYAVPLDGADGELSAIAAGRLPDPNRLALQPLPYRYATLVDRARQLVQLASQIEASLLATIEKHDAEAYSQLKGRQDIALAGASVRLKELQAVEARDGVGLAELQRDRSQLEVEHYSRLLEWSVSPIEVLALIGQGVEFVASMGLSGGTGFMSTAAGWDRRQEEWRHNRRLGEHDVRIGSRQVLLAVDRVNVAGQEETIAGLQADHAEQVLDYLTTRKVANALLYDWMSGVLSSVYRFFLQEATSMARLAEAQLAFERQEITPAFIQADYWEPPQASSGLDGADRFGLTGSARLLRDLVELDQHAFRSDQRKLQLTKTISLAQHDPYALQEFRETGVALIDTPLELFDRDFPGHYLRLLKRVRVSMIALIPPTEGIRATLSTAGASNVVIAGEGFSSTRLQRGPETVALSSPSDASGVFELDPQSELLAPFEGIGVGTTWQLRMPKASNPFDYSTIADVLLTLDYTALHSSGYEQQVLRSLDRRVEGERLFSLRNEFEDQWFDLHNPDQTATPMSVTLDTRSDDFPPNLEPGTLAIANVSLRYAPSSGAAPQGWATDLRTDLTFDDGAGAQGGQADPSEGEISTRTGNGANWLPMIGRAPAGTWKLKLPRAASTRAIFEQDELADILLLVSYRGTVPAWP